MPVSLQNEFKMLRPEEVKSQRAALEAHLADLTIALKRREDITVETAAEEMDNLQLAAQRELAISYLDMGSNLQRNIRAALSRIDDGDYGICLNCERRISLKRLKAVPWAAYCVPCQEAIDQNGLAADGLERRPDIPDAA